MSRSLAIFVLGSMLLLSPLAAHGEDTGEVDPGSLHELALELERAADEGYQGLRLLGENGTHGRRIYLQRLRTQARVLQAMLAREAEPEEIQTVLRTARSLARGLAEEATEGFASERFAAIHGRVQATAEQLGATLDEPRAPETRIAQGTRGH